MINFTEVLTDMEGKPLTESSKLPGSNGAVVDVTLRKICQNALLSNDPKMSGEEKIKRYILAQRIQQQDLMELSADDISLIKKEIAIYFSPLIVGKAYELLDPVSMKGDDRKTEDG